ncbi:DMT family transporter [Streptomyces subrutilus]|uniref:EamA family transporter n=1 Tax=Streptomyces subrutilus TaxID=36818 RepID=A0A5P2UF06_9ACTN|nr:DMT family transporter [Streptomyces subrutilus]QEU77578.1 EamA family transporter [Streptomyces subrutilus]WSJ33327.1 EamA family transporter [Streptomyces subrutilus]GGZ64361.1 membrane protein [Streptomyces subrutilus]
MRTPTAFRDLAPGTAGMVLVGSSVTASRSLVDAPLFGVQAVRYAAAALLLVALARAARVPLLRPRGREWLWLAGIAASGLVLFNVAVVRGVAHAEPAVIAVAVASVPVLLGLVGPVLEGRRPSRRVLLAAPVVVAGAVLVEGTGRTDAAGVGWAALALGCEAGFTLLAVPVLRRHGPWGVSVHAVWLGAAMLAVLTLLFERPADLGSLRPAQWATTGYLAVMVTAVAFLLWYRTVAAVGSGRAGLLTGIAPLAAAAAGVVAGGGVPEPTVWLGLAVVVAGLAAGLRPDRAPDSAAVPAPGRAPAHPPATVSPAARRPDGAGRSRAGGPGPADAAVRTGPGPGSP